ncbi:MAG: LptA/OstA family protein [Steroidobacteraceae bacterium]
MWFPERLRVGVALLGVALPGVALLPAQAASPLTSDAPLHWSSAGLDFRDNTVVLPDFELTQAGTRVTAARAEASGLDFENSKWLLSGGVLITLPEGTLSAETATLQFKDNRIASAQASGSPAQFKATGVTPQAASGTPAGSNGSKLSDTLRNTTGHSQRIDYDANGGQLRLSGAAWLSDGHNEISGERIMYELATQRVSADGAGGGQRVQGTIRPQPKNGATAPATGTRP